MTKKISEKEREKTLFKKEKTVFKKAYELSVLCGIELCLISYGINGDIKTFPEDQNRVANLARRFTDLDETFRRKRSVSSEDINEQTMKKKQKREDSNLESEFDYYSLDQLNLALESIDRKLQSTYEALENNNKTKNISHGNAASVSFEDINVQKMKKKKKKEDSNLASEFDYYSSDQLKLALESIDRKLQSIYEALENKNRKKNSHGNAASSQLPLIASSSEINQPLSPSHLSQFLFPLPAYLPFGENKLGFHKLGFHRDDDDKNFEFTPFVEFATQFNQDESQPQTSDLYLPYLESFEKKEDTRKQDLGFPSSKNNTFNGFLQELNQSLLEDEDDEDFPLFLGAEETYHQRSFENNNKNNTNIEESGLRNTVFGSN